MEKSVYATLFQWYINDAKVSELSEDERKGLCALDKIYNELKVRLEPEAAELLKEFSDAFDRHLLNRVEYYFEGGLKLGLRLGVESEDGCGKWRFIKE